MRRLVAAFFVALGLSLPTAIIDAEPAGACSCAGSSDAEAFAHADAVFTGTVAGYEPPARLVTSADPALWTFEVRQVYKGKVARTQEVVSALSGASCGLEIPKRGEILVFADVRADGLNPAPGAGQLSAGLCGGTRALRDGALDPALGHPSARMPAVPPVGAQGPNHSDESTNDARMIWIGAAAVAVVGALVVLARRRRAGARHA